MGNLAPPPIGEPDKNAKVWTDWFRSVRQNVVEGAETVTEQTAFGLASSAGVSNALSRADHAHGTPAEPASPFEFGSYEGDDEATQVVPLLDGRTPRYVWLQGVGGTGRKARYRTESMGDGNCLDPGESSAYVTDGITAFGEGSFTVADGNEVNKAGETYHFWVIY